MLFEGGRGGGVGGRAKRGGEERRGEEEAVVTQLSLPFQIFSRFTSLTVLDWVSKDSVCE